MNNLKFYLGVSMLVLSCLVPLLGFWVASLALPVAVKGAIIGMLTLGGPEVLALIAVSLLGKQAFDALTSKVFPFLRALAPKGSVTRMRYKLGLFLFIVSFIPSYVVAYTPNLLPDTSPSRFYVCMGADLLFVISLFVLGGDFWDKLKALFIYDARAEFQSDTPHRS
jgi:hypothetical protein